MAQLWVLRSSFYEIISLYNIPIHNFRDKAIAHFRKGVLTFMVDWKI